MVFDYFSFARAKKNQEDLQKTNPQNPVLNQEDEAFLKRVATGEGSDAPLPPTIIQDDGKELSAKTEELQKAGEAAGSVALPASSVAEDQSLANPAAAADQTTSPSKRTWASYVPSIPSVPSVSSLPSMPAWRSKGSEKSPQPATSDSQADAEGAQAAEGQEAQQTDAPAADSESKKIDEKIDEKAAEEKAADSPTAYPPGVKVTEGVKLDPAKQDADEKEVSVLLDRLKFASINNRVFAFSKESQKLYENFTIVLKDMVNGAPTAYEDMEKLLHDNDAQIKSMFASMPPFVQTLVKSLPAKFGSTLGPEILAAASDKPGNDMKARMQGASVPLPSKKNKRNVPSVKGLANEKGAVAGMLRSTVTFLQSRFPAFVTGTNVIMSLAVFILMFVFWYCHKRGKETRLQRVEAEASSSAQQEDSDYDSSMDESQILTPDSTEVDTSTLDAEVEKSADADESTQAAQDILDQPEPAEVPLPETTGEKGKEPSTA